MNDQVEGTAAPKKASKADMEQTCNNGVKAFKDAEMQARQAQKATLELPAIFHTANEQGMMGELETRQMIADAKAAAGLMAQGEAILWRLHKQSWDIEKKNGLSVGPLGGGPR